MPSFNIRFIGVLCYIATCSITAFVVSPNEHYFSLSRRLYQPRALPQARLSTSLHASSIGPGDTVLVVGGTGGVGQLVTKKLSSLGDYKVRVTSRDVTRGQVTIDDDTVDVVAVDLTADDLSSSLQTAMDGVSAVVISVGTTAFPTTKWAGGNTPQAIDQAAVERIAGAAQVTSGMKKIVLLTSIGVDRTKEMPFVILNLFGVLDAKKSGEEAVKAAAAEGRFDYAIVRPGRLVGGPYTNIDLAKLMQIEGGAENGVTVEVGDSLLGDCKRDACAEAVVRCLVLDECRNVEFSIVSNEKSALTEEQWRCEFSRMTKTQPQTS